jgi:hypothetical protein
LIPARPLAGSAGIVNGGELDLLLYLVHSTLAPFQSRLPAPATRSTPALSIFFLHLNPQMSWALDLMDIGGQRQPSAAAGRWQRPQTVTLRN